jgi:hypothetical protein
VCTGALIVRVQAAMKRLWAPRRDTKMRIRHGRVRRANSQDNSAAADPDPSPVVSSEQHAHGAEGGAAGKATSHHPAQPAAAKRLSVRATRSGSETDDDSSLIYAQA